MPVPQYASKLKIVTVYDPKLASDQLFALQFLRKYHGDEIFIEQFITILRRKEDNSGPEAKGAWNKRLVPFRLNRMQSDMLESFEKRNITVKWRQGGSTTFHIIDRLYIPTILDPGTNALLISQTRPYAQKHLAILQRAHRYFARTNPFLAEMGDIVADFHKHMLHTHYNSRNELYFDFLDSRVMVESAENPMPGQGITLHRLVSTETAYYPGNPEETLANLKEALVGDGTYDIESTPYGMGGYFYDEYARAKGWPGTEFKPHFYPWWWADDCEEDTALTEDDLTEKEHEMREHFSWTLRQVQWKRNKMVSLRHKFQEKYPEDDTTCFLTSGRNFFDTQILSHLKTILSKVQPIETHGDGDYLLFSRRVPGRRYIIGADPRAGELISQDNQDAAAAVVMDMDSAEEMAAYRSFAPPEAFGYELVDIARYFNDALICVERNNNGASTLLTIQRQLGYGNVYYHKQWFRDESGQRKVTALAGLPTTTATRPPMLNAIAALVRDAPELFSDVAFIDEAMTFVYNEKGKPEHQVGKWDDRVLCRAIACYCRLVTLGYLDPLQGGGEMYGENGEFEEFEEL
jgi:hypothetical protein